MQEIGREDLITVEEEVELAQRIRKGDRVALEKLTRANLRFFVSVAKQYQNQGLSLPDLINEGNFKLSHSYNTDLGCKGTTNYFVTIISSQLFHLIYILSYITKRMPVCIVPTPPFSLLLANITIFLPNYPYFLFLSQINGIHCTFS